MMSSNGGEPTTGAETPRPDREPDPQTVPIVALGASAGGLAALREFFAAMPSDSGAAFVVVQHLDPTRESQLAPLLAQATAMPVRAVEDGEPVEPNHVYVIRPNTCLSMYSGAFRLTEPTLPRGQRMPIDHFLESLAQTWGPHAIAIILSGTGSDGTRGLLAIKQAGGMALVQQPTTASYDGMPRSAVDSGAADFVVVIQTMPEVILRYLRHAHVGGDVVEETDIDSVHLATILDLVHHVTGHDLRTYRSNTLRRRIHRRMGMNGVADLDGYVELLRAQPQEVTSLFGDLLIGVTAFFREHEVFAKLENEVIPDILERKADGESIRAWVPGCSTGEEAYSIAILLIEQVAASVKGCPIQVFATDVDEAALDSARLGLYTAERLAEVDDTRRQRFFKKERGVYRASKDLRDVVVFAPHNLLSDPPFSQMDLVSCRNLLIYLMPDIQRKVIALFHFALVPGGYLVLGSAETLGGRHPLFGPVSETHRIYRRIDSAARGALELPLHPAGSGYRRAQRTLRVPGMRTSLRELTERALIADFAPAATLVDRDGEVLYLSGDTDAYLAVTSGEPTRNILDLVRRGLRSTIRNALQRVVRDGAEASESVAQAKIDNRYRDVLIRMKPLRAGGSGELYLVTFERVPGAASVAAEAVTDSSVVEQLEAELQATSDDLQSTIEELEGSNEELRASNEEVLSMNEELQSTNEELETSKEELQSLNEELATVNAQLQGKLEELARANNDIENLLASADLATLFLDHELHIKRYTAATRKLFNLIESDVGRAITDITTRYTDHDLVERAAEVLDTLVPNEAEVRGENGGWYSRRILPYRTADDRIEGVVVTFADIGVQKQAEEAVRRANEALEERVAERTAELAEAVVALEAEVQEKARAQEALRTERDRIDSILATAVDGVVTIDEGGTIEACNAAGERLFGYEPGELIGQNVSVLMTEPDRRHHDDYLQRYLRTGQARIIGIGREVTGRRKDGTTFAIDLSVGEMRVGGRRRYTGILRDVTERKELEEQVRQTQKMEAIGRLASGIAHDFNNLLMAISGCANIASSRVDDDNAVQPYLEEIREVAMSGASITRHLLTFARKREEKQEPIDLNQAVVHAQALLARLLGEDIDLQVHLAETAPWVRWDLGQLEQILMNLAVNARDAMPDGGRLAITVRCVDLDEDTGANHGDLSPGPHALLSVSDSGIGISEEIRAHIFEPFFTTKEPDSGTGLGLATVYGLVKQAGGHIEVSSEVGKGTTFEIVLRTVTPPAEAGGPELPMASGGHETILVVEDEPIVRLTLRHYLEQDGYRVLDANDGREALEICRAQSEPISMLITDVVLPGTPGPVVGRQIAKLHPALPVLFVSAHPPASLDGRLAAGAEVLQKPFTKQELTARVRAILDSGPARPESTSDPGSGTVLVVEDQDNARTASCELIEDMGYTVLGAADAAQALELATRRGVPVDALITDLGLPDMPGDELAAKLSPDLRPRCVVYVSGRSANEPAVQQLIEAPDTYFLEKPWDPDALEELLREALRRQA